MNQKDRQTDYLSDYQVAQLYKGAATAFAIGHSLNLSLTIHLSKAKIDSKNAHTFISRFLKKVGDWLRTVARARACYLYVLENPPGSGLNLHSLIHVPVPKLKSFDARKEHWFRTSGGLLVPKALHSVPITGTIYDTEYYQENLTRLLKYICKGAYPGSRTTGSRSAHCASDERPLAKPYSRAKSA